MANGWLDRLLKWPLYSIPFSFQSPLKHILHTSAGANPLNQRSRWVLSQLPVVYRIKSTFLSLAFKAIQREPLTHSLALSVSAVALLKCSHPKISIPQPQTALALQFLMATCSSCLAASCSRFVQLGMHICPFHPPWPKPQTHWTYFPPWSPQELCQTLVHPTGLTHFVFFTGHCTAIQTNRNSLNVEFIIFTMLMAPESSKGFFLALHCTERK